MKKKKIEEEKEKILYKGPDQDTLIQYFKDRIFKITQK